MGKFRFWLEANVDYLQQVDPKFREKLMASIEQQEKVFDSWFGGQERIVIPMSSGATSMSINQDIMEMPIRELLIASGYRINKELYDKNMALKPKMDLQGNISGYQEIGLVKALTAISRERFQERPQKPPQIIPGQQGERDPETGDWIKRPRPEIRKPWQWARPANPRQLDNIQKMIKHVQDKSAKVGGEASGYSVIISQNPHDIAQMSTNKDWTSCMNLQGGMYRRYVCDVIKRGGFVAYAVPASQANEIMSDPGREIKKGEALARVVVKPFIDLKNPENVAALPEMKAYSGIKGQHLQEPLYASVYQWISKNQNVSGGQYKRVTGWSDTFGTRTTVAPGDESELMKWLDSQYGNRREAAIQHILDSDKDQYSKELVLKAAKKLPRDSSLTRAMLRKWPELVDEIMGDRESLPSSYQRSLGLKDDWEYELETVAKAASSGARWRTEEDEQDMGEFIIPKLEKLLKKSETISDSTMKNLGDFMWHYKNSKSVDDYRMSRVAEIMVDKGFQHLDSDFSSDAKDALVKAAKTLFSGYFRQDDINYGKRYFSSMHPNVINKMLKVLKPSWNWEWDKIVGELKEHYPWFNHLDPELVKTDDADEIRYSRTPSIPHEELKNYQVIPDEIN